MFVTGGVMGEKENKPYWEVAKEVSEEASKRNARNSVLPIVLGLLVIFGLAFGVVVYVFNSTANFIDELAGVENISKYSDSCREDLPELEQAVAKNPENLEVINTLGSFQADTCFFYEHAKENFNKVIDIYENQSNPLFQDNYRDDYIQALSLLNNIMPIIISREIDRNCPPSHNDADGRAIWSDEDKECAKFLQEKGESEIAVLEQKLNAVLQQNLTYEHKLSCSEVLPQLNSDVSNDPNYLWALSDLANYQDETCNNIPAAREYWVQIMDVAEKIHNPATEYKQT